MSERIVMTKDEALREIEKLKLYVAELEANSDLELHDLLAKAERTLCEAQEARSEVMYYLEQHYKVPDDDYYEEALEDECTWCYGIDRDKVIKMISKLERKSNNV